MLEGFFTPGADGPDSYESLQRKRKMADALLAQSQDGAPIQSWTQGGAKLIQALAGSLQNRSLDTKERESSKAFNETLMRALGGQSGGAMPPASPSPMPTGGAAPVASGGGSAAPFSGSQSEFVSSMMPHAMKVSEQTGLDPRLVIAQSALETGWGKSAPGNNFFGIKSHGQSGGNTMPTTEVINGQPVRVNDSFRAYAGMGESAADYAAFLKANPRYRGVLGAQGLDAQIEAMAGSGYATDPNYGAKLRQIAAGMQTPDGMPTTPVPSNAAAMSYAPGQQAIAGAAPQQPAQGQRLAQAVTSPPIPAPQPTGNVQQAMMAVLSDPRFSPQQKSQAMQMFQMQQAKADFDFQVAGDQLYRINKRTGQAEPVAGASAAKPSDVQKQFQQAQREGFQGNLLDYQKALAEARRPQTNVNIDNKTETAADTEAAKALIKRNVAAMDAADKSQAAMGDITTMRDISRRVGSVGSTADLKAAIGPYAEAFGVNIDGLPDIQAFEAVIQRMAPQMRAEGSGSTSDIEFKGMLASLPRLRSNPQAREMILDTMEANARYNIMRGDIALRVLTKEIKREDGEKQMRALGDPMQAFKEFRKANPSLFTGPPPKEEQRKMTPEERALEVLRKRMGT
jgi:flagellar protein FlgJ